MTNTEALLMGRPSAEWLTALAVTAGVFLLLSLLRAFLLKRAQRPGTAKTAGRLLRRTHWLSLLAVALWVASHFVVVPAQIQPYLRLVVVILLGLQINAWVNALIDAYFEGQDSDKAEHGKQQPQRMLASLIKIVVWIIVGLLILENIPYLHISSLITGLGIGGIAVSLAAQKVIADLLSSITIRLEKPFVPGDTIRASSFTGKVEMIGLRSTRLRNLSGEELTFSNSDLLSSPVQNFSRMPERRVQTVLPISYANQPEALQALPELVQTAVEAAPNTRFGSFHLTELGDLRLRYNLIYFVSTGEFEAFQKAQNTINLNLLQSLRNAGIALAGEEPELEPAPEEKPQ